jgi:AcrR family transcriptional regulator
VSRTTHASRATRGRSAAERAARRSELLDAAHGVITTAGPEASMRAIAAAAGITKPVLYRYFGDKGGLYRALADRYLSTLVGAVRQALTGPVDTRGRARATIDAYLRFIESQPGVYRFLAHRAPVEQPDTHTAVSETIRRLGDEIGEALAAELDLEGRPAGVAVALGHGIVGMVQAAGDWWLEQATMSRDELTDSLTTLLLGGLGALDTALETPPVA